MLNIALWVSFAMLVAAMLLNCVALWRGPDLPDRVVALDTLYINAVALLIVFGIQQQTQLYFEAENPGRNAEIMACTACWTVCRFSANASELPVQSTTSNFAGDGTEEANERTRQVSCGVSP